MECLYLPELEENLIELEINPDERRHLRALRLNEGDILMASNGKGNSFKISLINKNKRYYANILEILPNFGEPMYRNSLALGVLSDRTRLEFAVEKAVELGIYEIIPIITKFCQKKTINIKRLKAKAIAAMKQTKRSVLPEIKEPVSLEKLFETTDNYKRIILADANGITPIKANPQNSLIIVGPEGGLDDDEIEKIKAREEVIAWKLADSRLRAETAAIAVVYMANIF